MKKLLIIYPHWMPSNLVGAQRARLLVNFFEEFGWKPYILAVDPSCYEDSIAPELSKLVKPGLNISFVKAPKRTSLNKWKGDLTLRAYSQIKKKAIEIIKKETINFVWLPIPSFYNALLGRPIHKATGVPYGIDYIDPWVNGFAHQEKFFSKAWISNQLAKILEPYAVKKASLISGVSYNYYAPVLDRNFKNKPIVHCAMQYGFNPNDFETEADPFPSPWNKTLEKPLIYAGAFLPKSHLFVELLFKAISELRSENLLDKKIRLYFFGTLHYQGKGIMEYAHEYEIDDLVTEKRERLSYLQILHLLKEAYGVMVIGSTEKHYSASKVFQSLLSKTPVFTIFHEDSEAANILNKAHADQFTSIYKESETKENLYQNIKSSFSRFSSENRFWNPDLEILDQYSARESAKKLVESIEIVLKNKS